MSDLARQLGRNPSCNPNRNLASDGEVFYAQRVRQTAHAVTNP